MRIGSLCSGYEGLGMAVEAVFPNASLAWVSDIDKGACKVLAHRYPDVPNIGDMTTVDWSWLEPVDVLTGGTPCQDLSHAGKRAGMTEGTRSNLWVAMREAIATIRPSLVIWENVGGAYSAAADSEMESRAGRVGDRPGGPVLRALGRVLGDLASLGYVGGWHGLRAADVGAPHGRLRVFVVATDAQRGGRDGRARDSPRTSDTNGAGRHGDGGLDLRTAVTLLPTPTVQHSARNSTAGRSPDARRHADGDTLADLIFDGRLHPTPHATDGTKGGPNQRGSSGDLMLPSAVAGLLPTPAARDWKNAGDPDKTAGRMAKRGQPLSEVAVNALLPTPSVADVMGGRKGRSGERSGELLLNGIAAEQKWGDYAAAIARWEHALGRPAPAPTMTSSKGNPQLSPAFTEWMMGLPAGWITDTPGVTRNEALKLCGNGVVPQQAEAAIRFLLGVIARQGVAA